MRLIIKQLSLFLTVSIGLELSATDCVPDTNQQSFL